MNRKPTLRRALRRIRKDPDVRLAVVFTAVFAWTLGFTLGVVLGEREASGPGESDSPNDS
jgi:hypothetical protein